MSEVRKESLQGQLVSNVSAVHDLWVLDRKTDRGRDEVRQKIDGRNTCGYGPWPGIVETLPGGGVQREYPY